MRSEIWVEPTRSSHKLSSIWPSIDWQSTCLNRSLFLFNFRDCPAVTYFPTPRGNREARNITKKSQERSFDRGKDTNNCCNSKKNRILTWHSTTKYEEIISKLNLHNFLLLYSTLTQHYRIIKVKICYRDYLKKKVVTSKYSTIYTPFLKAFLALIAWKLQSCTRQDVNGYFSKT